MCLFVNEGYGVEIDRSRKKTWSFVQLLGTQLVEKNICQVICNNICVCECVHVSFSEDGCQTHCKKDLGELSGNGAEVMEGQWQYQSQMEFLREHIRPQKWNILLYYFYITLYCYLIFILYLLVYNSIAGQWQVLVIEACSRI